MTARLLTNPVERLLLESGNALPEGEIKYIDITVCQDGSALVDIKILVNSNLDHVLLEVDKNCLRRVDE